MRRLHWSLALGLVILAAFMLRLFRLESQSLWYDEAFSVYLAHKSLVDITAQTAADIQPPLYYYLLHLWMVIAGEGEFALRFLSLFFGVLTIPLVAVTARHLTNRVAAFIATLLAALSPLYVWYSQEARMYTLITFLLLLSSYILLRLTGAPPPLAGRTSGRRGRTWLAFALVNIAACYTHYFAFAVIAFQGLYAFGVAAASTLSGSPARRVTEPETLSSENRSPDWKGLFGSFAAILLGFVPWMPFVIARLGQDASFWRGALKLDEAIRHIFISFTAGESVLEAQAQWLAAAWIAVLLLGLCAVIAQRIVRPAPRDRVAFPVLYLVVPLALLLFLFYRNPKFNARYLMIASPAFFLLLGMGLSALLALTRRGGLALRVVTSILFLILFGFPLSASAFADWNAYFDPAFTKADFRQVARYVDEHLAPGEAILMTSGHLFPAFDYYYRGDAPQIRLPDDPTLNTDHVVGYDAANVLNRGLAGRTGVWVVLWQQEVADPNGFVPLLLSSRGQETKVDAAFWQVRLRHWTLPADARFATEPQPGVARTANFSNAVKLLGYDAPAPSPADQGLSFNLYWQTLNPLNADYTVALRVLDAAGQLWGKQDRRPAGYNYPTTRWKPGENLFGAYTVPLLPGTPPGDYSVELTFYAAGNESGLDVLSATGAPVGKSVKLGPLPVRAAEKPAAYAALNIQNSVSLTVGPFTLLGYQLIRNKASAGERVPLTLFWRAEQAPGKDYLFQPVFGDVAGEPLALANSAFPTSQWRAGEIVRGQYSIALPASLPSGAMSLGLLLSDGSRLFDLAPFTVEKTDRVFVAPPVAFPQAANFGNTIALTGFGLSQTTVKPGDTLKLTLVWRARGKMDRPYTVFAHLLDPENKPAAQKDSQPLGGARPTTGWVENEYLTDTYDLAIKPEMPPGRYTLEIGWYDAQDPAFARLPVLDEGGAPAGDHVILKTAVTVGQ